MCRLSASIIDKICEKCFESFRKLPKSGKPLENEWTVLSCLIKYEKVTDTYKVVALGTGSKCIGASLMSPTGNILNDSHAEVVARRGFLLYLYKNIDLCLKNKSSIFILKDSMCVLKPDIEFIFYSSQLPCGDASIIPKDEQLNDQIGDLLINLKRSGDEIKCDPVSKKVKQGDIHRTGAKCLENSDQDPKLPGHAYHLLGKVRTKPGRGDRTLSVSCSDKLARWIHMGIQGSFLDMILTEPILIKHIIFGGGVPYSEDSLKRALLTRNIESVKLFNYPHIYQSKVKFPFIKTETNVKPTACSIIWVDVDSGLHEIAVQGKKLGVTKNNAELPKNFLCICKYNLFKMFKEIVDKNNHWRLTICGSDDLTDITYNKMKLKSKRYSEKWNEIKESFFCGWTKKPDIFVFK